MLKTIVTVVALLVGLCYVAFFLTWNGDVKINIVTWRFGGESSWMWLQGVPVGLLPLAGAVIGAVVMAIAAWGPWAAQRRAASEAKATLESAKAKLDKAVEKFNEQKTRLAERNEEIARLEARIAELEAGPTAETPQASVTADEGTEGSSPEGV